MMLPNSYYYSLSLQILHDSASFSFTVDDKVAMLQFTVLVITPDAFWSSLNALEQSVS